MKYSKFKKSALERLLVLLVSILLPSLLLQSCKKNDIYQNTYYGTWILEPAEEEVPGSDYYPRQGQLDINQNEISITLNNTKKTYPLIFAKNHNNNKYLSILYQVDKNADAYLLCYYDAPNLMEIIRNEIRYKDGGIIKIPEPRGEWNKTLLSKDDKNVIPLLTENIQTQGVARSSSNNSDAYNAQMAMDHDRHSCWVSKERPTPNQPEWIEYEFNEATQIDLYALTVRNHPTPSAPRDWNLLASNDKQNWVTLDKQTSQFSKNTQLAGKSFEIFPKPQPYKIYRLIITAKNGDHSGVDLAEFELIQRKPGSSQ
jgi:hypothetical protein